jgi:uncharacterized integral membrane protein
MGFLMSGRNRIRVLAGLIVLLLLIIVAVQNSNPVSIRMLFWRADVDGLLLFACLFLAGAVSGLLLSHLWRRGRGGPGQDR